MVLSAQLLEEARSVNEAMVEDAISRIESKRVRKELEYLYSLVSSVFNENIPHINWFFSHSLPKAKELSSIDEMEALRRVSDALSVIREIRKYLSLGIHAINSAKIANYKSLEDLLSFFKETSEDLGRMLPVENGNISRGDALVVECDNNMEWYDVGVNKIENDEANSMGNCGYNPEADSVLILREKIVRNGKVVGFVPRVIASLKYDDDNPTLSYIQCRGGSEVSGKYVPCVDNLKKALKKHMKTVEERKIEKRYPDGSIKSRKYTFKGKIHRIDGPAEETFYKDGSPKSIEWRVNGGLHREDGPAYQSFYPNGKIMEENWCIDDLLSRANGPAEEYFYENGRIKKRVWWENGEKSRSGGPTIETYYENGNPKEIEWREDGKVHRENGPAYMKFGEDGEVEEEEWHIHGVEIGRESFKSLSWMKNPDLSLKKVEK